MSKLEDFQDIPYEDEPRYTLNDVQEMVQRAKEEAKMDYYLDKIKSLEIEKEFYKSTIKVIFQNLKHFGGAK